MSGIRARTAAVFLLLAAAMAGFGGITEALGGERSTTSDAPHVAFAKSLSGVRFFTINEVLAQRAASAARGITPIRIASLDAAELRGALSDVSPIAYSDGTKAGPFGLVNFRAPEGLLWEKWRKLEAELRQDKATIAQCRSEPERCPLQSARRVSLIIDGAEKRVGRARLEEVNRSVNASIRYVSDMAQHGVPDLWSSALATFSSGQGDCEDYAIAKYEILRAAGVAAEDLRIMLVKDLAVREVHAVLAAQVNGKWLILDNRRSEIAEDRAIGYFVPLFALDHQGVSLLAQSYATLGPVQHTPSGEDASFSRDEVPIATPASGQE